MGVKIDLIHEAPRGRLRWRGRPGGRHLVAWYSVRQEREFQRLIAAGDAALVQDQTFVAIEAFSGALALKPDSMLAHLKRGDTYRRRGELTAALRDLRQAASLDPGAPQPVELLGDVNVAMGRYERAIEDYRRFTTLDDRAPRVLYKLALAYYRNGQSRAGDRAAAPGRRPRRSLRRGALPARHVPARDQARRRRAPLVHARARDQSRRLAPRAKSWPTCTAQQRTQP